MWKFFDSSGAEKVIRDPRASFVTALPANPADGDEIIFTDSLTAPTYAWHFRYVAAKASNKWVFVGGSPLEAEVSASETTASTSYVALTTAGPAVTLPLAGDYVVSIGAYIGVGTTNGLMSYDIGGTAAVDADAVEGSAAAAGGFLAAAARTMKKTGLTAVTLTAKYRAASAVTMTFQQRWIVVTPIAVGG